MGMSQDDISVRILAQAVGFKKAAAQISMLEQGLTSMSRVKKKLGLTPGGKGKNAMFGTEWNKVSKQVGGATKAFDKFKVQAMDVNRQMQRVQYSMLSFMFLGMQMQRIAGSAIRSIVQTFKKLDEKGAQPVTKALVRMEASFIFLKYAIANAFGPLLEKFSIWLMNLAISSEDVPGLLYAVGAALVAMFAIGGIMQFLAQMSLVAGAVNQLGSATLIKNLKSVGTALKNLLAIGLITLGIKLGFDALTEEGIQWKEVIGAGLAIGAGLTLMLGPSGWVIGGLVAATLLTMEILANPGDFGKSMANLTNFLYKLVDGFEVAMEVIKQIMDSVLTDFAFWLAETIANAIFFGWKNNPISKQIREEAGKAKMIAPAAEQYGEGYAKQSRELFNSGEMSPRMAAGLGLEKGQSAFNVDDQLGPFAREAEGVKESFEIVDLSTVKMDENIKQATSSAGLLKDAILNEEEGVLHGVNLVDLALNGVSDTIKNNATVWNETEFPSKTASINVAYNISGGPAPTNATPYTETVSLESMTGNQATGAN